jgi:DNA invertase Pin-like site-specific DNA recombinase
MFVRAYLRASTQEQDANRARQALIDFSRERGHTIAAWYVENASGARLDRPELARLLSDAQEGDVLLLEQVDRLSRLAEAEWKQLKQAVENAGVRIVALDLPTSWGALSAADPNMGDMTQRILGAVNLMMLELLAAFARKDYEDRRRRQAEGISKAKVNGKYKGRPVDESKHALVVSLRKKGLSIDELVQASQLSRATVHRVLKKAREAGELAD